ncbi:probable methyltransferase-like protein 24 [Anguilla rostrata]|uniref:probable methyltransferase-like protein 24 n=1 Tax=Anguilla rostrata TaxID=7938 RepID=UPI0030D03A06
MQVGSNSDLRRFLLRLCLLVLPLFLVLQLLVGLKVPNARRVGSSEEFGFTIISIASGRGAISPDKSFQARAAESGGPELWDEEVGPRTVSGPNGYEDENEMTTRQGRAGRQVELQPWAAGQPSFTAEVERFISYITTPQAHCTQTLVPADPQGERTSEGLWTLCVEGWTLPAAKLQSCVAYSFSLGQKDEAFVKRMLWAGCEVHQFDPGRRQLPAPGPVHRHHTWLDWRSPRDSQHAALRDATPRKLSAIMDALGHGKVQFINADLESAEWKVLESWVMDGTLGRIQQLVLTVHLQWAGFEVGGNNAEVIRFWYSVIQALHMAGFRLLHSFQGPGQTILGHTLPDMHSTYTLSWVNTRAHH